MNSKELPGSSEKKVKSAGLTDEFGIPINIPVNHEPIPVGLCDEKLGIFPEALNQLPYPLLPCNVHSVLQKKIVQPQDASLLQQVFQSTFSFLIPTENNKNKASQKASPAKNSASQPLESLEAINDLSKAYYKGQIPEVVFVHATLAPVVEAFIEDMSVYIEKLMSMGFINLEERENNSLFSNGEEGAVHKAVPCIALVGHGFLYQSFLRTFLQRIERLGYTKEERKQLQRLILGRVCRAYVIQKVKVPKVTPLAMDKIPPVDASLVANTVCTLRIAGGLKQTQRQIQHALGRNQVVTSLEQDSQNPAERLEIFELHATFQQVLLPHAYYLAEQEAESAKARKELLPIQHYRQELQSLFFSVGLMRGCFEPYENTSLLNSGIPKAYSKGEYNLSLPEEVNFVKAELRTFWQAFLPYLEKSIESPLPSVVTLLNRLFV